MTFSMSWMLVVALGPSIVGETEPVGIAGGQGVAACGWPSVVLLRGNGYLCTGNLVHPEIVVTAAHCLEVMEPETQVEFGDTANTAHEKVDVEYCTGSPDFVSNGDGTIAFDGVGNDWGYCKLAAPITDVEPIPIAYGCELDGVQPGATIVRVGYGKETLATNQFFKRWVETTIVDVPFTGANGWPTQLSEGGGGEGTCPGDSGGPSFIQVADGSWRMVAIQSTQPIEDGAGEPIECGTEPNNTAVIAQGVELIESESGIDVTPCFATDGGWDPVFACSEFPLDPGAGGGTWGNGCATGPLSGFSDACGISFDQGNPDMTAMTLAIVDPPDTVVQEFTGEPVELHVLAEADDGPNGWGVARVDLLILDATTNAELGVFEDATAAYEWTPQFGKGAFLIRAIGYDNAGNVTETADREIWIGVDPPASDSSGGTEDGGADETAGDVTGGDATGEDTAANGDDESDGDDGDEDTGGLDGGADIDRGGNDGCGCRSDDRSPAGVLGLVVALLGVLRSRRR